jgi:hypothetical protein
VATGPRYVNGQFGVQTITAPEAALGLLYKAVGKVAKIIVPRMFREGQSRGAVDLPPQPQQQEISGRNEREVPSGFQEQRHINPDWGILVKAIVRLDTLSWVAVQKVECNGLP